MKNKRALYSRTLFNLPAVITTGILFLLAMLHLYWAGGGRWGHDAVLPTSSNGLHRLEPGPAVLWMVAFAFVLLTIGAATATTSWQRVGSNRYSTTIFIGIALLFLLRAIGDFKFFGLFKVVSRTPFALRDTQYFTPFSLLVAVFASLAFFFSISEPPMKTQR